MYVYMYISRIQDSIMRLTIVMTVSSGITTYNEGWNSLARETRNIYWVRAQLKVLDAIWNLG
jgi:hypothetical protein